MAVIARGTEKQPKQIIVDLGKSDADVTFKAEGIELSRLRASYSYLLQDSHFEFNNNIQVTVAIYATCNNCKSQERIICQKK